MQDLTKIPATQALKEARANINRIEFLEHRLNDAEALQGQKFIPARNGSMIADPTYTKAVARIAQSEKIQPLREELEELYRIRSKAYKSCEIINKKLGDVYFFIAYSFYLKGKKERIIRDELKNLAQKGAIGADYLSTTTHDVIKMTNEALEVLTGIKV